MTKIYIKKMNEIIRGFAQARLHWHSSKTFSMLNHYVFNLNWRFAYRRHKDKNRAWLKENYFTHLKLANIDSKWVFRVKHCRDEDPISEKYMYNFYWFKITDYLLAKMDKLPDNKEDIGYYEKLKIERSSRRPFNILFSLDNDLALSQSNICPVCREDLFNGEKVHIHHIIPRAKGGKNEFQNLVLLHQYCHLQTHIPIRVEFYKCMLQEYRRNNPRINKKKKILIGE